MAYGYRTYANLILCRFVECLVSRPTRSTHPSILHWSVNEFQHFYQFSCTDTAARKCEIPLYNFNLFSTVIALWATSQVKYLYLYISLFKTIIQFQHEKRAKVAILVYHKHHNINK